MRRLVLLAALIFLVGCKSSQRDPRTVVFLIESSPANLDPRIGTDGLSEHIDELLFDGLVQKDANFTFAPALAERWELSGSSDAGVSSARWRAVPRWTSDDCARRCVEHRIDAQRRCDFTKGSVVRICCQC